MVEIRLISTMLHLSVLSALERMSRLRWRRSVQLHQPSVFKLVWEQGSVAVHPNTKYGPAVDMWHLDTHISSDKVSGQLRWISGQISNGLTLHHTILSYHKHCVYVGRG